jgi:hypothetical protein
MAVRMPQRRGGSEQGRSFLLLLVLLALFFFAGIILGQVFAGRIVRTSCDELFRYLTDYFSVGGEQERSVQTFLSALIIYFRYPLLAFLLGFASIGTLLLPVLSALCGFFLSYSVCCLTAAFGSDGVLLALVVFGIRCLIMLPCFFALAVPSFQNALSLAAFSFGRGKRLAPVHYGADWWLRLGVTAGLLLAGTLTELTITPRLLHLVLSRILQ